MDGIIAVFLSEKKVKIAGHRETRIGVTCLGCKQWERNIHIVLL